MDRPGLLIYAHYYAPDVASTGQLMQELAEGLTDRYRVTVICAVPSYDGNVPEAYRARRLYRESLGGVELIRVRVPAYDKTSRFSRVRHIAAYFLRALGATLRVKGVDVVMGISQPPVLGGLLGAWGGWVRHAPFLYDVQDWNPEQMCAVHYAGNPLLIRLLLALDRFSCRRAARVIVVGRDMADTLMRRFFGRRVPEFTCISNWVDDRAVVPMPLEHPQVAAFRAKYGLSHRFVFMYSGNLGLYYGLERLFEVLRRFPAGTRAADGREVAFAFVGDGCMRGRLEDCAREHGMDNVTFIPYQEKSRLNYSLNAADVHWCVSAAGICGVSVPSKIYGEMAVGKPVLGVMEPGAEARRLIEAAGCGRACAPGDVDALAACIREFIEAGAEVLAEMGMRGRRYLERNLTKSRAIGQYADAIGRCIPNRD